MPEAKRLPTQHDYDRFAKRVASAITEASGMENPDEMNVEAMVDAACGVFYDLVCETGGKE